MCVHCTLNITPYAPNECSLRLALHVTAVVRMHGEANGSLVQSACAQHAAAKVAVDGQLAHHLGRKLPLQFESCRAKFSNLGQVRSERTESETNVDAIARKRNVSAVATKRNVDVQYEPQQASLPEIQHAHGCFLSRLRTGIAT
jgi:hypothetical protein